MRNNTCDSLEPRCLLSSMELDGRVLRVAGDHEADIITITVFRRAVTVDLNGALQTFSTRKARRIEVRAGDGADTITLVGKVARATIFGEAGDDTITGGLRTDSIYGGAGDDELHGGGRRDSLYGEAGNDQLFGEDGPDWISGGEGDDLMDGAGGNDWLLSEAGSDTLIGGDRHDTASYQARVEDLQLSLDDQLNDGAAGEIGNIHSDVEDIWSGSGNDTITGSDHNNALFGGDGNDSIQGLAGRDFLHGQAGDDYLHGGSGKDFGRGGKGRDTLVSCENDIW